MEVEKTYVVLFCYFFFMCLACPVAYAVSTWIAQRIFTFNVCKTLLISLIPKPNPKPAPSSVVLNSGNTTTVHHPEN